MSCAVTTFDGSLVRGPSAREIRPRRGWQPLDWRELWRYRELLWFLALRDVQVRYKQTALGALWAVIQPLGMMVVLSFVLSRLLGQDKVADPIFLYAALLPWTFFAATVTASSNSLISNADMLRKIYFPRLLVPIAAIGAPLVDFAIALVVLAALMLWYGVDVTWQLALLAPLMLTVIVASAGVGVFMAAVTVTYRDFRYVVPFLISVGFFLSGVIYDAGSMHWMMHLNPMSGTIAGFRAAVLGSELNWVAWGISAAVAVALLVMGLTYFARSQRRFADVI